LTGDEAGDGSYGEVGVVFGGEGLGVGGLGEVSGGGSVGEVVRFCIYSDICGDATFDEVVLIRSKILPKHKLPPPPKPSQNPHRSLLSPKHLLLISANPIPLRHLPLHSPEIKTLRNTNMLRSVKVILMRE
jgi:hypothetical protein